MAYPLPTQSKTKKMQHTRKMSDLHHHHFSSFIFSWYVFLHNIYTKEFSQSHSLPSIVQLFVFWKKYQQHIFKSKCNLKKLCINKQIWILFCKVLLRCLYSLSSGCWKCRCQCCECPQHNWQSKSRLLFDKLKWGRKYIGFAMSSE